MPNQTVYNSSNNGQTELVSTLTNGSGVEVTTSTSVVPTVTLDATLLAGTLAITADSGATAIVDVVANVGGNLNLIASGGTIDTGGLVAALASANATIQNGGTFIAEITAVNLLDEAAVTFGPSTGYTNTLVLTDTAGLLNLSAYKAISGYFADGKNVIDDKLIAGSSVLSYSVAEPTGQPQVVTLLGANNVSLGSIDFAAGSFTQWQAGTYAIGNPAGPLHVSVGSDGGIALSTNGYVTNGAGLPVTIGTGAANTQTLVHTAGSPDSVTGSNGTLYLADAQGSVSGGGDTIYFDGSPNDLAILSNTNGAYDNVIGSNGSVVLNNAITGVVGGGDVITFASGNANVASLWNTNGVWDNVIGSNGQVFLNNAITGVVGGGNTITFSYGSGDAASLWNTNGVYDTVIGSNGSIALNNAMTSVIGGGDTISFAYGSGNVASIRNTGANWDNVIGSNGTVELSNAITGVVGGGNAIDFVNGTGNVASLWNTAGAADTVTGSNGGVAINNAQAIVNGNANTIYFTNAGADSVTANGTSDSFVFQLLAGQNTLTGFDATTDQLYLSAGQFGSSIQAFLANDVTQVGGNTIVTDPNNHLNQVTLTGISPSSLTAANTHFS